MALAGTSTLLLLAAPARAGAAEPENTAERASQRHLEPTSLAHLRAAGLVFDMTARFGAGSAIISEDGAPVAELATGCFDARLGLGTFVGSAVKLGFEATVGDRRVMGNIDRIDETLVGLRSPIEGDTWYVLPLGGYLEIYPWRDVGFFLGLHGGVGTFWPADYLPGGRIELAGAASVEIGYERALGEGARGAVILAYAITGFGRSHIDEDYTSTLNSDEVSLAVRLSLF